MAPTKQARLTIAQMLFRVVVEERSSAREGDRRCTQGQKCSLLDDVSLAPLKNLGLLANKHPSSSHYLAVYLLQGHPLGDDHSHHLWKGYSSDPTIHFSSLNQLGTASEDLLKQ